MTLEQFTSDFFTAGGTLPPDAPSYVKRPADDELFRHAMAGEFCYVLTPRQMGKSSLMIRTAQRLSKERVKSAIVDLNQIGTAESEEQWYKGLLTQVKRRLRLNIDPVSWWEQKKDIPKIQKFIEFFEEVLVEIKEHVVIFIDEIDTTLELDFRDDFFTGIRAIYNARAENSNLKRITFVLLGVASPSELIKDRNRTPFNIGQEIPLRPFSREDARMLEKGLEEAYPKFGKKTLDRIFYWTNGHPYLTQKLCKIVVEQNLAKNSIPEVDTLVEDNFFSEESSREANLQFIRDRIINSQSKRSLLKIYSSLLEGKRVLEKKNSSEQIQLKLSGLVTTKNQDLIISNEIYHKVFDQIWVKKNTEKDWRPILIRLLAAIVSIGLVILSLAVRDFVYIAQKPPKNQLCFITDSNPTNKLRCLAELFRSDTTIIPNDNSFLASNLFFSQASWADQSSIFMISNPDREEIEAVIKGLYTSLADVDRSGENTKLLSIMLQALQRANLNNSSLAQEIQYWLSARESANQKDYVNALESYNQAILLNPNNPATLFERARIFTKLGRFEDALIDYEQALAISPKSENETPEIPTSTITATVTEIITSTPAFLPTLGFIHTSAPALTLLSDTEYSSEFALTQSVTPTLFSIPTPVYTATFASTPVNNTPIALEATDPIQSMFSTLIQRIVAVRNDIDQNEDLKSYLYRTNVANFPNLKTNVLLTTPRPTPLSTTSPLPQLTSQYYVIVLDASIKMNETVDGRRKWDAALGSVHAILEGLNSKAKYGLVIVGGSDTTGSLDPCGEPSIPTTPFTTMAKVQDQINQVQPGGGGSFYTAFNLAKKQFDGLPINASKTLIFITGSSDTCQSQDEWNALERAIQITDTIGIYSEIITIDKNAGLKSLSISEYIKSLSVSPSSSTTPVSLTTVPTSNATHSPTNTATLTPTVTPTLVPSVEILSSSYLQPGVGCQIDITVRVTGSAATGSFHVWNANYPPEGDVYPSTTLEVGTYSGYLLTLGGLEPQYYEHEVWFEYNGTTSNHLTNLVCPGLTPSP